MKNIIWNPVGHIYDGCISTLYGEEIDLPAQDAHTNIINTLIKHRQYSSYLEIGTARGRCFSKIECAVKVGVDPTPSAISTHKMTSDVYFETHHDTFDVIFVDGLHLGEQVRKDVENALLRLNEGGIILTHDCFPPSLHAERKESCGTSWRGFVHHRQNVDLDAITMAADYGLGFIVRGANPLPITLPDTLSWQDLVDNKSEWSRLTQPDDAMLWLEDKLPSFTYQKS